MPKQPPGNNLSIGTIVQSGGRTLTLPAEARGKHLYVAGATGTGKSKFLEHLIWQDIRARRRHGSGMLVVDLHGKLYDDIMKRLASRDIRGLPIIPIDFRRDDWIVSYNMLRKRELAPTVVVDSLVEAMLHAWGQDGVTETPRLARWLSAILTTLYERGYTLAEAVHLTERTDLARALSADLKSQMTSRSWRMADNLRPSEFEAEIASTLNRLRPFLDNPNLRSIFGTPQTSLDLRRALDAGWIILASLATSGGQFSDADAKLFGTVLLSDLWTAAKERGKSENVRPFRLYLDEFQEFVTPSIARSLDQARGFGLHLTMAHQFPLQLLDCGEHGKRLYHSVMVNARNKVVFHMSMEENLKPLAEWLFRGMMNPDEIKLSLSSPTVTGYREEYRTAYGKSSSTGHSGGHSTGFSNAHSVATNQETEVEIWNEFFSETYGSSESWSSSKTESQTKVPMLIPQVEWMQSHVQFRSLDEQLYRAMAALFDQKQRQCVARFENMTAPVSVFTPWVKESYIRSERVETYIEQLLEEVPFAVPLDQALRQLSVRERYFQEAYVEALSKRTESEPHTAKRRLP